MSEDLSLSVFYFGWGLAGIYLVCAFWLARRLNSERMRKLGFAGGDLLSATATFRLLGFIFSDQHVALSDATVTRLTYTTRTLFVILIPLFLFHFVSFGMGL